MSGVTVKENLVLGVLELSPAPLSARLIAQNYNVDADAVKNLLGELETKGHIRAVEDGYFELTDAGRERVLLRGSTEQTPRFITDRG